MTLFVLRSRAEWVRIYALSAVQTLLGPRFSPPQRAGYQVLIYLVSERAVGGLPLRAPPCLGSERLGGASSNHPMDLAWCWQQEADYKMGRKRRNEFPWGTWGLGPRMLVQPPLAWPLGLPTAPPTSLSLPSGAERRSLCCWFYEQM